MWWSRTALALAALLAACGFEPMYGRKDAQDVPAEFAFVRIEPIADRVGQMVHNHLRDALNARGVPAKPRYILKIKLSESTQGSVIQKNAFASRADLTLTGSFTLYDAVGRSPLHTGSVASTSSYNILTSDFGTLAAEKDARERAAAELAEEIRLRLAVFFRRS